MKKRIVNLFLGVSLLLSLTLLIACSSKMATDEDYNNICGTVAYYYCPTGVFLYFFGP